VKPITPVSFELEEIVLLMAPMGNVSNVAGNVMPIGSGHKSRFTCHFQLKKCLLRPKINDLFYYSQAIFVTYLGPTRIEIILSSLFPWDLVGVDTTTISHGEDIFNCSFQKPFLDKSEDNYRLICTFSTHLSKRLIKSNFS
jgi:hypothetical protein